MLNIYLEARKCLQTGQPCVIATVVRTAGSTPQKPGAKLLVRQDGSTVGTLGGGCVEGAVCQTAAEMMSGKSGRQYQAYELNDDMAARDGLVCGGTMHVYLEPVSGPVRDLDAIIAACQGGQARAQATLLASELPGDRPGSRMVISHEGREGSLGRRELDEAAAAAAARIMDYGKTEFLRSPDNAEVFVEGFASPPTLVVIGAGHVGRALVRLAATVGFRTFVIDDHPDFAARQRFPEAEDVFLADYPEGLARAPIAATSFIVIATRGHRSDDIALEAAVRTPAGYVGLVGSKRKTILIFKDLVSRGVDIRRLEQVRAPIGLDIGAVTPDEIAVSIVAEMLMFRLGGTGAPLKLKESLLKKAGEAVA